MLKKISRFGLLATCSSTALFALSQTASAACEVNPTQANATTTCTGTETRGLLVETDKSQVLITPGAVVWGPDTGSIVVRSAPAAPGQFGYSSTITVQGSVTGGSHSGIFVSSAPPGPYDGYSLVTRPTIVVEQGGLISGDVGIDVAANPLTWNSRADVSLTNHGTIIGSSGLALRGDMSAAGRFESIFNGSTGVIGAIEAQVGQLTNDGLIDGGSLSAYSDADGSLRYYGQGTVVNRGTMQSSGASSTIFLNRAYNPNEHVHNAGLIENTGSGSAISGAPILSLTNDAGGMIRSNAVTISAPSYVSLENYGTIEGGEAAIVSQGAIILVNRGTIIGDIRSTVTTPYPRSIIDNVGGTIEGDVLLGAGNDVFIAEFGSEKPFGTVTGSVDAGGGIDSLRYVFGEDTTLSNALELPASFERFEIRISNGSTLTLDESVTSSHTLAIGGGDLGHFNPVNTLINKGRLTTTGSALVSDTEAVGGLTVINEGIISASLTAPSDYAVDLSQEASFTNGGSIIANGGNGGNGVRVRYGNSWSNSGTITADGTAVFTSISLANTGTLRSTQGIALDLNGALHEPSTNSGTIEGALAGARVYYSTLLNSGTISSAANGVEIGIAGIVVNQQGGVITGGVAGVAPSPLFAGAAQGARIYNAGVINGAVSFGSYPSSYGSGNVFVALAGGVVNGDLHLGSGNDIFVTDIVNNGPGEFAGLTGKVTGGGFETIIYRVSEDRNATLALPGIFDAVGYELDKGAKLTLTATSPLDRSVSFGGSGSVDLTADFSRTDNVAITTTGMTYAPPGVETAAPSGVTITSRGTIDVRQTTNSFLASAVRLSALDSFVNEGTVKVVRSGSPYYGAAPAISGGKSVTNNGTILVDGVTVVADASTVINTGSIRQVEGGIPIVGFTNVQNLTNSGVISTSGNAVLDTLSSGRRTISNSGTIESRGAEAIRQTGYGSVQISNAKTGLIAGGNNMAAIASAGGRTIVENAGLIKGNVLLGSDPMSSYYQSGDNVYIAAGGKVEGDVRFGSGNDMFLVDGTETGVVGVIDAGLGFDTYGRSFRGSGAAAIGAALPASFEGEAVEVIGADTTVTLTGPAEGTSRGLALAGNGTIVNKANFVAGSDMIMLNGSFRVQDVGALAFVNEASSVNRVIGTARSFSNSGSIGAPQSGISAVALTPDVQQDFNFTNTGTIQGGGDTPYFYFNPAVSISDAYGSPATFSSTLSNAGSIVGGIEVAARRSLLDFTNTGTISADGNFGFALGLSNQSNEGPASIRINNSGLIKANNGTAVWAYSLGTVIEEEARPLAVTLINTGSIVGDVSLEAAVRSEENWFYPPTSVSVDNGGSIDGSVVLGGGDDRFLQRVNATVSGIVDGGWGSNQLVFELGGTSTAPDFARFVNFQTYALTGTGVLSTIENLPFDTIGLTDGSFTVASGSELATRGETTLRGGDGNEAVVNNGTIAGAVEMGGGDDSFANNGSVGGGIDLGAGNDRYSAAADAIAGVIHGNHGLDTLSLRFEGTGQAPTLFDPARYLGFETLEVVAGTAAVDGPLSFEQLIINGGRVIGYAGSMISVPRIVVAPGATFGSAGTVVGDIAVSGTLSPGASPGTMSVTGNVSLASGSTSLFELTSGISDQLVISGTLVISGGATLALTGNRPLMPGTALDLVIADGGITGAYSNVSQSSAFGFIRQTSNRIQLLGQFINVGFQPQTAATIDYVNAVLVAGQASPELLGALPSLLTQSGATNGTAFALLNAEAYASATQIGIEHGLTLAKAGRVGFVAPREGSGWFGFGQALGNSRELEGRIATGVSQANVNSYGLLGGIGYAAGPISIGGFIGHLDSDQDIWRLNASTSADGVFGGIVGRYADGAFSANAVIGYDGGSAETSRALPGQRPAKANYELRSWIADVSTSYAFTVAPGWSLTPQAGYTYISTRRGGAVERDGGPFALSVAGRTLDASFLDAALTLQENNGAVRPWTSLGIRYQLSGKNPYAQAAFTGATEDFLTLGAGRAAALATVGAGLAADIGPGISAFGAYQGEFGHAGAGHNVNVGLRAVF